MEVTEAKADGKDGVIKVRKKREDTNISSLQCVCVCRMGVHSPLFIWMIGNFSGNMNFSNGLLFMSN